MTLMTFTVKIHFVYFGFWHQIIHKNKSMMAPFSWDVTIHCCIEKWVTTIGNVNNRNILYIQHEKKNSQKEKEIFIAALYGDTYLTEYSMFKFLVLEEWHFLSTFFLVCGSFITSINDIEGMAISGQSCIIQKSSNNLANRIIVLHK